MHSLFRSIQLPQKKQIREALIACFGSSLTIAIIALLSNNITESQGFPLLIGSFGASAVLTFGASQSPLAQPRNLIGGHVVSACIGVTCAQFLLSCPWLAASLAVSLSIVAMMATKTLHPPGGATALIAVTGGEKIYQLGYWYVLVPCLAGVLFLFLISLLINNTLQKQRYPQIWW